MLKSNNESSGPANRSSQIKSLEKYSIGLGDRFGHQGSAQLKAIIAAAEKGIEITPVWNKSNREHAIIGTVPADVRTEANMVTGKAAYTKPYFVDADHINLGTVDPFIECSDFFTIDVAAYIDKSPEKDEEAYFLNNISKYKDVLTIPGTSLAINTPDQYLQRLAGKYLFAAKKAAEIYRKIEGQKGKGSFITEVSMDEVTEAQTPADLFFILKMLAYEGIPVNSIAPKFSGRFNKGVDYVGDPLLFAREFEQYLQIIEYAVSEFGLPEDLKISIHSGSDKFSLYPHIGRILSKTGKGVHIKTAGTTWLEEVIGLSESGSEALEFTKEIYSEALGRMDELCLPYSDVINIRKSSLPSPAVVAGWSGAKFANSLRHVEGNPDYNPDMRQLIHVAYKLAAIKLNTFYALLEKNAEAISECVFENMYDRHIRRLFDF
jgi:tagaturonate epimerase